MMVYTLLLYTLLSPRPLVSGCHGCSGEAEVVECGEGARGQDERLHERADTDPQVLKVGRGEGPDTTTAKGGQRTAGVRGGREERDSVWAQW
jgi:hypothetical protein